MDCKQALERLHELVDGELPGLAEEAVRQHLASCPGCFRTHGGLSSLKRLVQQKVRKLAPPPALLSRVVRRLRRGTAPGRSRPWARAALAAGLAFATVLGLSLAFVLRGPRLGHAEASSACADAFRSLLSGLGASSRPEGWQADLLGEVRRGAGVQLDHVPEIPNAAYLGWQVETVSRVKTIRMDFRPLEGARDGIDGRKAGAALISVFFLPLKSLHLEPVFLEELEKGHPCTRCVDMRDGSIFCFRSRGFLLTVVSTVSEEELLTRHRPR
ncbi:MAG: zf-HC2 domain-containing protein [Planctomycetes bacterium]|nr:zf-HC2 domain-containing protein [Planctomycetota bacterium]